MGNNTNAIGKSFEVFASKTLEQATDASFVSAHPAAICFTPEGQIVFGGDVYSQHKTWSGTIDEYDAIATKDPNTTYYVNDKDDAAERRVFVGETLVLGAGVDYNFTGLLYGSGSAGDVAFYFYPLGSANAGGKVAIKRRTDRGFKADVGDVMALGTLFFGQVDSPTGVASGVLKEITKFPTIVGDARELFMGQKNLEVIADGALQSSYDDSVMASLDNRNMFSGCASLKSVDLSGLTYLGRADNMFSGCASLKSVQLPKKFGYSCQSMFSGCASLNLEVFPPVTDISTDLDGLAYIPYIYSDCTSLTGDSDGVFALSSAFSDVVTADYAFKRTSFKVLAPTTSSVDASLFSPISASIMGLFYGNKVLERVEVPINAPRGTGTGFTVNSVYRSPFYGCDNLTYAVIKHLGRDGNAYLISLGGAPKWGSEDDAQCVKDTLLTYSTDVSSLSSGAFVLLDQEVADRLSDEVKAQITAKGYTITTE